MRGSKHKHLLRDELNGNVKKYFFDCDFRINLPNNVVRIPDPWDGHCILYAWKIGLTAYASSNNKPSYKPLKEKVRLEFLTNSAMYNRYFYDNTFVQAELKKILEGKSYSRQIGDMMFHALANATSIAIVSWIYEREYDGPYIQTAFIAPRNNIYENGVIDILHDRQHYEPLVDGSIAIF